MFSASVRPSVCLSQTKIWSTFRCVLLEFKGGPRSGRATKKLSSAPRSLYCRASIKSDVCTFSTVICKLTDRGLDFLPPKTIRSMESIAYTYDTLLTSIICATVSKITDRLLASCAIGAKGDVVLSILLWHLVIDSHSFGWESFSHHLHSSSMRRVTLK